MGEENTNAHLQHVGEVGSDALHQHAVGSGLGALPAGHVAVALAHQDPHLLHGRSRVHVVAESLVDSRLPAVETGQGPDFQQRLGGGTPDPNPTQVCLPVVQLHLLRLPLFEPPGDVGGGAQDVLDVEEELLRSSTGASTRSPAGLNQPEGVHLRSGSARTGRPTPSCWGSNPACPSRNA